MSPGQLLSLLLIAQVDPNLSVVDRARAAHRIESLDDPPEPLEPGLTDGGRLTQFGIEVLHAELPFPTVMIFPFAVADVLRRSRLHGLPCAGVRCEAVEGGWRVSWDGDGWQALSRLSNHPIAEQNRNDLIASASVCGLEVVPEAAASLLVRTSITEYIEAPSENDVNEHQKLWERYCKASDKARAENPEYEDFRRIDDDLFAKYLEADAQLLKARFQPSMNADGESHSGT